MGTAYNIPNCIGWYRATKGVFADAGVTPALPGQPIYQWNDQSGANNHLTQSNSDVQPLKNQTQTAVTADGAQTIANYGFASQVYQETGRESVVFDGNQLYFDMPSSIALNSAGCTVLMCTRGPNFSPVSFGTDGTTSINYGWIAPQNMAIRSAGLHSFPAQTFLPALSPIIHGFRCSAAATQTRLYMGMNQTSDLPANYCNFATTGGAVGETLNANDLNAGNFNFLGEIHELLIFTAPLTDPQIQSVLTSMHAANALPLNANSQQIIFIGDALTAGGQTAVPFTNSYPWALCQQYNGTLKPLVIAGPGEAIADQQTIVNTSVLGLDRSAFSANIAIVTGGSDEIANGQTAAQVITALTTLCTSLKSAGFKVIITTLTPRDSTTGYTSTNITTLNTVNTTIRSNYTTYAHALADWAADPRLSDCTNPLYFSDGMTTTPAGNYTKATIIKTVLDPFLPNTNAIPQSFAAFYTPGRSYTGTYGSFVRS